MSTGDYFSMEDGDQKKREKKIAKSKRLEKRDRFLDKAKEFMDESSLGTLEEGKKFLNKILGREDETDFDDEMYPDQAPEADFISEADEIEDDGEELDMSQPEHIRVGYAKPGSAPPPPKKTLEEARDESFDMKMGNLSGLLTRFGAEGAEDQSEQQEEKTKKVQRQIDKPLFQRQMRETMQAMSERVGEPHDMNWIQPDILTLLRGGNDHKTILNFIIGGVFAKTDENFMGESDRRRVVVLAKQIGLSISEEDIIDTINHLFIFTERVFRLYDEFHKTPPTVPETDLARYKDSLAKIYIHQVARRYDVPYQKLIQALAVQWTSALSELKDTLEVLAGLQEQYELIQERKISSSTLFTKMIKVENQALSHFHTLRSLALEVERLKEATGLMDEAGALEKLQLFDTQLLLEPEELSSGFVPLPLLIQMFRKERQETVELQLDAHRLDDQIAEKTSDLSPLAQKRAITHAKMGDPNALKTVESYKADKLQDILKTLFPRENIDEPSVIKDEISDDNQPPPSEDTTPSEDSDHQAEPEPTQTEPESPATIQSPIDAN